jgi:hypothetical protein
MSILSQTNRYRFNILDVISNRVSLYNYVEDLNLYIKNKRLSVSVTVSLREIMHYATTICSGLPSEEEIIENLKSNNNTRDKGLTGKIIEYGLFGQKPNQDSSPDISKLGYDIKTCAFKSLINGGKNAKERQTLTNCGSTKNYETFKNISSNEKFSDCQYYKKSKRCILIVRNDDKIKLKTFDQLLNQKMLYIICFDIEKLPYEVCEIINNDYAMIRRYILEEKVSQKGQTYLHIHPHGAGHGSGTRALGYTANFITLIVALNIAEIYKKNIEDILIKKGRSVAIKDEYI